ncbi:hypothetical protein DFS34DRAFT_652878 [Phlyctochytrium arcticum]|nr:hypothetical protein DFS34DRAFT_652878 [Phlyctochytrium arcticum]
MSTRRLLAATWAATCLVAAVSSQHSVLAARPPPPPSTAYRYDRPSVFSKQLNPVSYTPTDTPAYRPKTPSSNRIAQTAAQSNTTSAGSFQVQFICDGPAPQICQLAKQGLENAASYITQSLAVKGSINVYATFRSFCHGVPVASCGDMGNTLGMAMPASYFPAQVKPSGGSLQLKRYYLYPQALMKQLRPDKGLDMAKYDILADFNSDFDFWFRASGTPIQANQTDFEFVVAHELTHGLGWDSSLVPYNVLYKDYGQSKTLYVAPGLYFHGVPAEPIVDNWMPLTAFDSLIKVGASQQPLEELTAPLYDFWPKYSSGIDVTLRDFIASFERSGDPFQAAAKIHDLITQSPSPQPGLRIGSTTIYATTRAGTYEPGSSLTHIDLSYNTTQDFLMVPSMGGMVGKSLQQLIDSQNKGGGIYGPHALEVLRALGWESDKEVVISTNKDPAIRTSSNSATSLRVIPTSLWSLFLAVSVSWYALM